MFCFCLQSSLLKLRALESEGGPSAASSPEERPLAALGTKEQKSPCSSPELGAKETLAMFYSGQSGENNTGGTQTCLLVPCLCVYMCVPINRILARGRLTILTALLLILLLLHHGSL